MRGSGKTKPKMGPSLPAAAHPETNITHLWNFILCTNYWNSNKGDSTFTLLGRLTRGWSYHKVKFSFWDRKPITTSLQSRSPSSAVLLITISQPPWWEELNFSFLALQPTHSISKSDGFSVGLSSLAVCLYTVFAYDNKVLEKGVWSWVISDYQRVRALQSSL